MTESAPAADLLSAILSVLERIEERIDAQEQRLNVVNASSKSSQSIRCRSPTSEVDLTELAEVDRHLEAPRRARVEYPPSLAPGESAVWDKSEDQEVPYSDLGFSYHEHSHDDDSFKGLLETYVGDCWKLPGDRRLPLHFGNRLIDWTHAARSLETTMPALHRATLVRDLERLQQFDKDRRARPGNDFLIIDYDSRTNCRLYRIGSRAVGSEPKVSLGEPSHHQWSRLMYAHISLYLTPLTAAQSVPRHDNWQ